MVTVCELNLYILLELFVVQIRLVAMGKSPKLPVVQRDFSACNLGGNTPFQSTS